MARADQETVEDLFRRFQSSGEPRLLATVYDRVAPELLLVAVHLGHAEGDAEDLLQETFVTAIEHAQDWDPERPLLPWLLGVLGNRARRMRRDRRRHPDPDRLETFEPTDADPLRAATDAEFADEFARKLRALPEGYREVLTLRWVHGLTPTQIAHSLGTSIDTIKTRLRRGNDILRKALPAGFAAGALASLVPARDLASVREAVLAAAETAFAARTAAAGGAGVWSGWQVWSLVLLLGFAAGLTWGLWPEDSEPLPEPRVARAPEAGDTDRAADAAAPLDAPDRTAVSEPTPAPPRGPRLIVRFEDGTPVPDALLLALPTAAPDGELAELERRTDRDGVVELTELAPGSWELTIARGGATTATLTEDGHDQPLELTLPDGVDLTLFVHAGATPLADAGIWLSRPERPDEGVVLARTDATGRCTLRDVAPGRTLSVLADGYAPLPMVRVPGEPGERHQLDLDLATERSLWAIRGRVVAADTGEALPGARLQLGRRLPNLDLDASAAGDDARVPPITVHCDADGRFAYRGFTIYGGTLDVWVRAPGYVGQERRLGFADHEPDRSFEFRLEPGGVVTGTVRGEDGQPIAAARIHASRPDDARLHFQPRWARPSAVTDADGRFTLHGVPPPPVRLAARAPDGRTASERHDDFLPTTWDPTLRTPAVLRGFVVDPRGAPIEGLQVRALVTSGRDEPAASLTDAAGRFALQGCDALTHTLWVTDPASPWTGRLASRGAVRTIDEPQTLTVPDALRPTTTIAGRIVAADGQPLQADLALGNLRVGRTYAQCDAEGRFAIGPLPALDHWDLFLRTEAGHWGCAAGIVTTERATTDLGDLVLRRAGQIRIKATAADGGALERVFAKIVNADGLVLDAIQLVDGEGRSSPVPAGPLTVHFHGDVALQPLVVEVPEAAPVEITPVLVRGEPVLVAIDHPDDGWHLRARVAWFDADDRPHARDFVQLPSGPARQLAYRLPAGTWRVEVETHTGRRGTTTITLPTAGSVPLPTR